MSVQGNPHSPAHSHPSHYSICSRGRHRALRPRRPRTQSRSPADKRIRVVPTRLLELV